MACTEERDIQIIEFATGKLAQDKVADLMKHILTCQSCAADFGVIDDLKRHYEKFGDEMFQIEVSFFDRLLARLKAISSYAVGGICCALFTPVRLLLTPVTGWKRVVAISIPAIVAVVLALVIIKQPSDCQARLQELAMVEVASYDRISVREESKEYEKLFIGAMKSYSQGKYEEAIRGLYAVLSLNPKYTYASFYLGVCYLLEGETNRSIGHFEKIVAISEDQELLEKSHWYLANAHLKKGDGKRAIGELEEVIVLDGDYGKRANELLEKIRMIMK